MTRIGLVILNRNESDALPEILPRIPFGEFVMHFAVDGRSTDSSPEILRRYGIEVITQTAKGRGDAFRLAFEQAGDRVDALVFFSPDGNEDPADLPKFRSFLEAGSDMVIASRMMEGAFNEEDMSWFRPRKWANLAFNWLAYLTWGRGQERVTDGINGYRAITSDCWKKLDLDGPGYTIEYQSTIRAYKTSSLVSEFPTTEGQRIGGVSDAKAIRTGVEFLMLYWKELRGA
jgi:glycosyltransferase involved in cell wall biosynthesis